MITNTYSLSDTFTRVAAGALAVALTAVTVTAAKAETDGKFRDAVETGIRNELRLPSGSIDSRRGTAIVAVSVDSAGNVRNAQIVQSAGFSGFDREALRTARTVSYPATGENRTVAMVLGFNQQVAENTSGKAAKLVAAYAEKQKVMFADKTSAQQPDS
ncbi:MAG: energy transducer TonB [Sphingobium sp.]